MIVRTTDQITGTDRERDATDWTSKRIVLADDDVGFSFHETTVKPGTETPFDLPRLRRGGVGGRRPGRTGGPR